ncbi:MAG: T9SS type A sorting domain-containing protein [Flavobacteriales bacterium]|nr:T9SS type A sorting domain-containing protein [Flavobacteriales bacterium]
MGNLLYSSNYENGNQWTFESNVIGLSQTLEVENAGDYILEVNNGVCTFNETSIQIVEDSPNTIIIQQDGNSLSVPNNAAYSYQWYLDGIAIEGAIGSSIMITQTGDYAVEMISQSGCTGTVLTHATFTGIETMNNRPISVFPNPASEQITITTGISDIGSILRIYAAEGKLLEEFILTNSNTTIDLSGYSTGLYSLVLLRQNEQVHMKLILESDVH